MNFKEFCECVCETEEKHPNWFALNSDPPADINKIHEVESKLKVKLPEKYKQFLNKFGGGEFAFVNIFSVEPLSDYNVALQNSKWQIENFVSISDDQTGGIYGYKIEAGQLSEKIHFWSFDECCFENTIYDDIFEFIVRCGLRK